MRSEGGNLITAQGDAINADPNHPSEIVEFDPRGKFVAEFSLDPQQGSAFGLALEQSGRSFRFAAANDDPNANVLEIWDVH